MRILHTNDLHGSLTRQMAEKLSEERQEDFYFDCGDCVQSGNMGVPREREPVWDLLSLAGCTASVPGNREFHITEAGFRAKLAGCKHPVLAANLEWKGEPKKPLIERHEGDFRLKDSQPLASGILLGEVGVFGVMVPMVTGRMTARHLSAFVNTSPVDSARKCVERLRECSKAIICLSHVGLKQDISIAETVDGIDLILGGHSHDILEQPVQIRKTFICQTGSHGRYFGLYELDNGKLEATLHPLK